MQNEYYMRQKLLNSNVMYNVLECLELKEKLEKEWEQEVSALEFDQTSNKKKLEETRLSLDQISKKLELYRVHDENLRKDRWSLDTEVYQKK